MLSLLALLIVPALALGQEYMDAVLYLTGQTDAENLDEQVLERFSHLHSSPLEINLAGRNELVASGLFTMYQAASLLDYRSTSGDVLSFSELAQIDGFGKECAEALGPFCSLYSPLLPGQSGRPSIRTEALLRGNAGTSSWGLGAKVRVSRNGCFDIGLSPRYKGGFTASAFASVTYRRGKVIVGDFSARFGQGLALWSGFTMSGAPAASSFSKRPSGISESMSWSDASIRGIAADCSVGRHLVVSGFVSLPSLRPWMEKSKPFSWAVSGGGNISWYARHSCTGVSLYARDKGIRVAVDSRVTVKGTEIFAEGAWDGCFAFIAGAQARAGESTVSIAGRLYPGKFAGDMAAGMRSSTKTSDEAGIALAWSLGKYSVSADLYRKLSSDRKGIKAVAGAAWNPGRRNTLKARLSARIRNYAPKVRVDARMDWAHEREHFLVNERLNLVKSSGYGLLGYLEPGVKAEKWHLWFRGTLFMADSWDDRIYCYERDAPGSFNVPAYYGRGYSVSLTGGCNLRFRRLRLRAYLRASHTGYPFMKEKKPGSTGLSIQLMCDI